MKKHAIIPIFISHRGCPNDCVFCNQKKITARQGDVTPGDARRTIEEHLSTLADMNLETVEIAFFGGSFTGIPMEDQKAFLAIAKEYKDAGKVSAIHLSTRPDYINEEILDNLKAYSVDVIELGVQSLDPDVLRLSGRGHDASVVYESSALVKEYGFTLGIQLMIGLPGDTLEKCIFSAMETVKIGPQIARLYPTVVIKETALYDMYLEGSYTPLSEEEAVNRTKAMYKILDNAGINIIRVGLKSSDIMADQLAFHPAFRQLVEGRIARERLEAQVEELYPGKEGFALFISNEKCYNNMFGHKGVNRSYFADRYPRLKIKYVKDADAGLSLADNQYKVMVSMSGNEFNKSKEVNYESSNHSCR
ncbi:MAG: elongator complex protein 3 [Anaerovoracaceae bacterium]